MPDFESLFPGRFLKKTDIPKPTTVRIVSVTSSEGLLVTEDDDEGEKRKEKPKGIMCISYSAGSLGTFQGSEVILCKTNAALIAAALGERDFTKWAGHLITLYNCPSVRFGAARTGGIRVYGSPEMKKAITVEIKMPRRKKPEVYELVPTEKPSRSQGQQSAPPPAASADQPPPVDEYPEPGSDG